MGPAATRDAATVILVRQEPGGLEALLLERHPASRFAPGAFAFPGGRLEPADAHAADVCHGLSAAAAARTLGEADRPAEQALAFWVGALREAFEEVGVLLARDPAGRPASPGPESAGWAGARADARRDAACFPAWLRRELLRLATDRMVYFARWITPEERPVRFDARFFLAAALPGMEPVPDGIETVGVRWMRPADALAEQAAGRLALPFPTQQTLRRLAPAAGVAEALDEARGRAVAPVRPRVLAAGGRERILLPGEPGYY
jgi:8-oxo-dGTP pyrophosphatase MutT (NUDIX family)